MDWLNYHHLHYFWVVAREGGLVQASRALGVSHPTVSAQVHALEQRLDASLFVKVGRRLELTDVGQTTYRYAEEIFTLGREMVDTVQGRSAGKALRLNVGIVDVVPKLIVRRLLEPAIRFPDPVRLVCTEDSHARLLGDLAQHALHIVISDSPVASGSSVRAFSHVLGESAIGIFGHRALAKKYKPGFPQSLDDAPFLLPLETLSARRSLNQWFTRHHIRPRIVAEFADSALFKAFGADGVGLFAAPLAVSAEICHQYGVVELGAVEGARERFYAISAERRVNHPVVVAMLDAAKAQLLP